MIKHPVCPAFAREITVYPSTLYEYKVKGYGRARVRFGLHLESPVGGLIYSTFTHTHLFLLHAPRGNLSVPKYLTIVHPETLTYVAHGICEKHMHV